VPTQPAPGQQFLEAAASSFPCLPETANKVVPMPWVKVKPTPPPVSKPTRVVGQDGVSEGVLMRNIRMKEALGLSETSAGGGGGGGVSGSSGGASSSSLLEAAAKERLACVWPPILRKWYSEIPSEVIKIERKLKDLINDPKGTSISLKPMNREDRRLCHLLGEFYLLNTRSDDNNDGHGLKCMTFILTNNSQIPLPLLSEALIFERKYPDLIAKSLKYQADLEFEKQKEIDYRGYQGGNNETHCSNCLLLKNVPDLISLKEIRQLILLFVELGQVIDLFQVDLPGHHNNMGMDDHGLEYCVVFKTNEIAEHVFKTSSCNSVKLPFTIHRYPLMQLTDKQPSLPIHHKPDLFDSWNDNDNSDQNNMNQNDTENETSTKIDDEILLQQSNDMKQNEKESTHGAAEDISTSPLLQMGEVASDWEALADTCEAPVAE
jgi:hypothetical protein